MEDYDYEKEKKSIYLTIDDDWSNFSESII